MIPHDETPTEPTVRDNREEIRFVTCDNKTRFSIRDGDYLHIKSLLPQDDGPCRGWDWNDGIPIPARECPRDLKCRYIDDSQLFADGELFNIWEFEFWLGWGNEYIDRVTPRIPAYDVAFTPDGIKYEWKEVPIADEETMLKNLVGDVIKTGRGMFNLYNTAKVFQGANGTALFGLTRDGELTSLQPDKFLLLKALLSNDIRYRVDGGVFFEDELEVISKLNAERLHRQEIIECLSKYHKEKEQAQNSSCVIDTNKAKASNTETNTKVASAKKDTGRGR
ncbi:MAG: hypothetical protein LBE09_07905 [Christensenellaceae bacterium]|jgi:hypothetical protein|nr:hypothetical protein [Christensenellaceae bacterium]